MTFINQQLTRPGLYLYRHGLDTAPFVVEVSEHKEKLVWRHFGLLTPVSDLPGLWCGPLIPAEELENAQAQRDDYHKKAIELADYRDKLLTRITELEEKNFDLSDRIELLLEQLDDK